MRLDAGSMGAFGERPQGSVLNAVASVMSKVFIPSLQRLDKGWGTLDGTPQGAHVKAELINTLDTFVGVLNGQYRMTPT
jgi:hypothetical protein